MKTTGRDRIGMRARQLGAAAIWIISNATREMGVAIEQVHMTRSIADQIVVSGSNFVTGVLIARFLGIDQFGVFSLAWLVVLLFESIQAAVIAGPMLSIGPKQTKQEREEYYGIMFLEQFAFSGAAAALVAASMLVAVSNRLPIDVGTLTALIAVVVALQTQEFLRRYNFSRGRSGLVLLSDAVRYGTQLAALLALFVAYGAATGVVGALLVIAGSALLGGLVLLKGRPIIPHSFARLHVIVAHQVEFSKWLFGAALVQWTTGNAFLIVVGALLGPTAVGAMRAAQNLLGVTHVYFQAAENVLSPLAARVLHEDGAPALRRLLRTTGFAFGALTSAFCLLFAGFPDYWLTLVFGPTFEGYGLIVVGYAAVYLLLAFSVPLRLAFLAMERTQSIFKVNVIAAAFALASSYPLVNWLGVPGAVAGVVLVHLIGLLVAIREYRRSFAVTG
ncbi:MAG: oligosaccharide flippase family protein [Cucumibacter sp.]